MQGFEESYVLESVDGLGYTQVKPLPAPAAESDDDRLARLRRLHSHSALTAQLFTPLRQQLADQQQRRADELAALHNPFKAPRGLDGEEIGWLDDEAGRRRERERRQVEEAEEERMAFELAVARRKEEEAARQAETASKQQQQQQQHGAGSEGAKAGAAAVLPSTFSFAETNGAATTSPTHAPLTTSVGALSGLGAMRVKRKDDTTRKPPPAADKAKRAKSTNDDTRITRTAAAPSTSMPSPATTTTSALPSTPAPTAPSSAPAPPAPQLSAAPSSNGHAAALTSLLSYGDDEDDDD